ncbi:hypothetical protein [Candidatus Viadribacter manganicus]|uniref:Uncharacterized protein n=1 Tax=Candidatus Viadribacter manganicus TaxID=1759059 RepID=A0A1B1AD42_9PROT|nr:hypothetical protein [Candidatus Viadribacter manganicus]ANP44477.1 hypothetical protein ATE48_00335 [Candidatus Viadribacter manganicus]
MTNNDLLDDIRSGWRIGRPGSDQEGCITALRHNDARIADIERLLDVLRKIEPSDQLDRALVAECWSLPYYMRGFVQASSFDEGVKAQLGRLELAIVVELQRILGVPREVLDFTNWTKP